MTSRVVSLPLTKSCVALLHYQLHNEADETYLIHDKRHFNGQLPHDSERVRNHNIVRFTLSSIADYDTAHLLFAKVAELLLP